jgi:RNA polymerase-binding transcription factor DksA
VSAITQMALQKLTRRRSELGSLWPERALDRETAELLNTLSDRERRERHELADIDAAIARVENGTFGHCERCGGAIGRQRLAAVPQTRYCIACESQLERERLSNQGG